MGHWVILIILLDETCFYLFWLSYALFKDTQCYVLWSIIAFDQWIFAWQKSDDYASQVGSRGPSEDPLWMCLLACIEDLNDGAWDSMFSRELLGFVAEAFSFWATTFRSQFLQQPQQSCRRTGLILVELSASDAGYTITISHECSDQFAVFSFLIILIDIAMSS